MLLDQDDIERNMRQFHLYALRTLHFAALEAYYERSRRANKEVPFSDLPFSAICKQASMASDFDIEIIFRVYEFDVVVQDAEMSYLLTQLSKHLRDIILLKYFLGWTDKKIGELYGQHGFTIRARRLTALKKLRIIYEQSEI